MCACTTNNDTAILQQAKEAERAGNNKLSAELYEKACNTGNAKACHELSYHYLVFHKDENKAFQLWEKSCKKGIGRSCLELAYRYNIQNNHTKALELSKKACNLKDGFGCKLVAEIYQAGKGVQQDKKQAKSYFNKACNFKVPSSCDDVKSIQ